MVLNSSVKSSRRQTQKEETRRIITASAYALFNARGYEKTTMRALARHADVGLGTIFKHFPDKASLLVGTFYEDIDAVLQNTFNTIPENNIKMQLTHITVELYEFFGSNKSFSRTLIRETLFLEESDNKKLAYLKNDFQSKIEALLKQAIAKNELDRNLDIRNTSLTFAAFFLLGLVDGLRINEFNVKKQTMVLAALLENHIGSKNITEGHSLNIPY
jgi:AcrR family transcriptional regulator